MKTLVDLDVRSFLGTHFVLFLHNQLPELYCNTSVDPGVDRYPGDQVDSCPESAGAGNLRIFLCRPSGELVFEMLGYWKPARFLEELRRGMEFGNRSSTRLDMEHSHRACLARHRASQDPAEKLLVRAHEEALRELLKPVGEVLERIEDEIYTKGAIG